MTNWLTSLFNNEDESRDEMPVERKVVANDLTSGLMKIASEAGSKEWFEETLKAANDYYQSMNIVPVEEDLIEFMADTLENETGVGGTEAFERAHEIWEREMGEGDEEVEAAAQPKERECANCDNKLPADMPADVDLCDECDAKIPTETEASKKTAAYVMNDSNKTTIEKDYQLNVESLSNYNLAEMITEHTMKCIENYNDEKKKQLEYVAKNRKAAEKKLLDLIGEHSAADWKAAFKKFESDPIRGKDVKEKDIKGEEVKIGKQNWEKPFDSKPLTDKQRLENMKGIGHEEDKNAIGNEELLEKQRKAASLNKKAYKVGDKLYYRGHPCSIKEISINPFSLDADILIDCEGRELHIEKKEWKELGDAALVEDLVQKEEPKPEAPKMEEPIVEEKPIELEHIEEVKPGEIPVETAKKESKICKLCGHDTVLGDEICGTCWEKQKKALAAEATAAKKETLTKKAEIESPWKVIKGKDGKDVIARVAPGQTKESKDLR